MNGENLLTDKNKSLGRLVNFPHSAARSRSDGASAGCPTVAFSFSFFTFLYNFSATDSTEEVGDSASA